MAVTKTDQETKLLLKVETGTTSSGKPAYSQRSVNNMNPALSDADFSAIGESLGNLQEYPVAGIERQDQATLVNED